MPVACVAALSCRGADLGSTPELVPLASFYPKRDLGLCRYLPGRSGVAIALSTKLLNASEVNTAPGEEYSSSGIKVAQASGMGAVEIQDVGGVWELGETTRGGNVFLSASFLYAY